MRSTASISYWSRQRSDPQRTARLAIAGAFGFFPAVAVGGEAADVIARVVEPLAAYLRAHPPTASSGPTWIRQIGPLWHAFTTERAALPWVGWPILLHHPDLLLGVLGFGLLGGVSLAWVAGRRRYAGWGGPTATGKGQYGSAHWRPVADLAVSNTHWTASQFPQKAAPRPASAQRAAVQAAVPSGLLIGADRGKDPRGGWLLTRDEHAVVMAITRAGKTRRLILPSIGIIGRAARDSMVITDPKGELYAHTAEWLRTQGYRIIRFDLIEPKPGRSEQFNPMAAVNAALDAQDWAAAAEAAYDIGHILTYGGPSLVNTEPVWINGQIALIAAVVLLVSQRAPDGARHLGSVYATLIELGENEGVGLALAMAKLPPGHPARMAYGAIKVSRDRMTASFFSSAIAALRLWGDPHLIWLTAEATIDFAAIGASDHPTAVFLEIPHEKKTRYPIASLAINQMFRALTEVSRAHGGRLPRNVTFLLDEFGNMPQFPDFDQFITVSAGMGIRLVMVLQNLEQLKKNYQDTERTIRGNAGTWLFLRTSDLQSAKELAEITGQYTIPTESLQMPRVGWFSTTGVGHPSEGQALAGRDLVKPDEFLRWPPDWVWHWQAGYPPAMLPLPDLSQWRCFAPIATPHPFTPWATSDTAGQVGVWSGIDDDDDQVSPEAAPTKGGDAPMAAPDIAPSPVLNPLFDGQLAPIDPDDIPES